MSDLDLILDSVHEPQGSPDLERFSARSKKICGKVTKAELRLFAQTLANLLGGGVPLLKALAIFGRQSRRSGFQTILQDIQKKIEKGEGFAASLESWPEAFPFYFSGTVWAGEISGNLERVLHNLARHIEKQEELQRKFIEALTYPCIVLALSLLTVTALFQFVIPRLAGVYHDFGMDIPLATRFLLSVSRYFLPAVGIFLILGFLTAAIARKSKRAASRYLQRIPFIGSIMRKRFLSHFCALLALLMQSGIPVLEALKTVSSAAENGLFREDVQNVSRALAHGEGISTALAKCVWMPPAALALIEAGEESGRLPESFRQVGEETEKSLEFNLFFMMKFLEPLLILAVGLIVGGIVIAVVMPMMRMNMMVR